MSFRRFFTITFLVIILGSITVGTIYLYNFDLNSFREEIETLASERISRPLTLGKAHLSFKHGPAFAFDNVKVGTTDDDLYMNVERLFFRIQTLPLLSGEILFSEILLEKPNFTIRLQPSKSEVTPFRLISEQRLLTGELIKSLRVLNGTIQIIDSRGDKEPEKLVIEELGFSIDDFSFLNAGNIKAKATLLYHGVRSPFSLNGKYHPNEESTRWDTAFYHFNLSINNLAIKTLSRWTENLKSGLTLRGHADLGLQIEGSPQTGITFSTKLAGRKLELIRSAPDYLVIPISQTNTNGRIQYDKNTITLEKTKLTLDTGYGRLETENDARLTLAAGKLTGVTNLGRLSIRISPDVILPAGDFFTRNLITSYQIELNRTKYGWTAKQGEIAVPGLDLAFRGQWHSNDKKPHSLTLDIAEGTLPAVTAFMPGLNHLNLNGRFDAHLSLDISSDRPLKTVGTLNLSDVHLSIPGPLADLNRLNGSIVINDKALSAQGLKADLGDSAISVDLSIPDLSTPDINLHVLSDSIRADELVFTTEKKYLKQVDGIVRIADKTVFLGPIHVKMDGGTSATVNGTVRNFAEADVALDIQGKHGNIDEIIALWKGDHPQPLVSHPRPLGSLNIDIKTESGQISGMPFDQATSQIVLRNKTLVIGPIHFRSGDGEGKGQVLLVKQDDESSLLKISGHIENFKSKAVYNQLLKQQGLVSGQLSGDFYIEGIAGKQFLPTSIGGFSVRIEEGRLNKLTGLSKVLHILNLYPLLTENVKGKGLPFESLTFNTDLTRGVLATEDFLIHGDIMNLSMTGNYNIINNTVDFDMAAMPLRSVDSIISHIPIAGWILTGNKKSLVVAHFEMTGSSDDPDVKAVPLDSVTTPVLGILERVFTLPVKIVTDPEKVLINQ